MPNVLKSTPVLFVEMVEPCVVFWRERFGFTVPVEVPSASGLAFALLQNGGTELMYQSFESLESEPSETLRASARAGRTFLYVEVPDIQAALAACAGLPLLSEMHDTFYGAREFAVADPGGHVVTFAQQGVAAAKP